MQAAERVAEGAAQRIDCAHCGLPVPPVLVREGEAESFCCPGCEHVHRILLGAGLETYYDLRDEFERPDAAQPARWTDETFAAFDRDVFRERHVRGLPGGLARVELLLEGVRCAACVWLVERLPRIEPGVHAARLGLADARVEVDFDPARTSPARIARALASLGYPPHPVRSEDRRAAGRREERRRLVRLAVAAACAGNAMLVAFALYSDRAGDLAPEHATLFRWTGMGLCLVSLAWPGAEFFRGAWAALRTRAGSLDVPIALALLVGAVAGTWQTVTGRGEAYFDSLTVLVFLLLVGRWVQFRQQAWARRAVDLARAFTPSSARRVEPDGSLEEVAAEELAPGDVVEVRTGETLPADGRLTSGHVRLDRSLLTGEAEPVACDVGERVHGGTRNVGGTLRLRVEQVGAESRVGKLLERVERGLADKPAIQRLTDRIAWRFVSVVSALAMATFLGWTLRSGLGAGLDNAVALLIVACPCALGIATPLTLAVAAGRAANEGLLVQNAGAFEALARGGRLVLDKTGTLTFGRPQVTEWVGDESLQGAVAALEAGSVHPIGRALVDAFGGRPGAGRRAASVEERQDGGLVGKVGERSLRVGSILHLERNGCALPLELTRAAHRIEARGESVVAVAADGRARAVCGLADRLRPDAADALEELRVLGFEPEILSGDAVGAVRRAARDLRVPSELTRGACTPEQKQDHVRALRAAGERVAMVGDGVNDAAALTAADVGVSVHGSAEASLLAADIHVARAGLVPLVRLVHLSRRTLRTIRGNLLLSLGYNALAIGLAMVGLIDPLAAAILMPISSATVLVTAMLSLRPRPAAGPRRVRRPSAAVQVRAA